MAAKKRARPRVRKSTRRRRLGPYDYLVKVVAGYVMIEGSNGGNVYGKPGQQVTFTAAPGVGEFTFKAVKLQHNDSMRTQSNVWPFRGKEPTWPRPNFSGELRTPVLLKSFYKYKVSVTGKTPADPLIIVER